MKTIKIRNDRSDLIIVIISTQIEWKSGMKERKKKRKERKNDRIISEGDWSPNVPNELGLFDFRSERYKGI